MARFPRPHLMLILAGVFVMYWTLEVAAGPWRARHRGEYSPCAAPSLEAPDSAPVPGAFIVQNLQDSGAGSLRAAVQYANANPGTTISFIPGLCGTINLTSGQLAIIQSTNINGPGAYQLAVSGTPREGGKRRASGGVSFFFEI